MNRIKNKISLRGPVERFKYRKIKKWKNEYNNRINYYKNSEFD